MKRDFESILDECLHNIEEGQATIEMCVARYPQHAERLEVLLRVAEHVRAADHPDLPPSVMAAIEGRLLRRAVELRGARARTESALEWGGEVTPDWVGVKPPLIFSFGWLRVATVTLVLILALVLAGGGVMVASAASLPGSPLYGLKRTTERVQLALTFRAADRATLHLKFAERRLEEEAVLTLSRREFDEATLSALNEEIELALLEARAVSERDSMALWERIVDWTEHQQRALQGMQCQALEEAQTQLVAALETSQRAQAEAIQMLRKGRPVPQPSSTLQLTLTPEPTLPRELMVTPIEEPTLQPTSTLGSTPPPEPAEGPEEELTGQLPEEPKMKPTTERRHPVAEKLSLSFGVEYSEVADLHASGLGFGVIARAYCVAGGDSQRVVELIQAKENKVISWEQINKLGGHQGGKDQNLGKVMSGREGEAAPAKGPEEKTPPAKGGKPEEVPGKGKGKEEGGPPDKGQKGGSGGGGKDDKNGK